MQKPSENWKRIRHAVLNRVHRTTIEAFSPVYSIHAGACAVYLAGFLHFNFFAEGADLTWLTASLLIVVVFAGALVPLLTGSVITLHFAGRRLSKLMNEPAK